MENQLLGHLAFSSAFKSEFDPFKNCATLSKAIAEK